MEEVVLRLAVKSWCGVDPWILGMTLKKNKSPYVEFYDGKLLKEACELALNEGLMLKNGLYHYSIPIKETFMTDDIIWNLKKRHISSRKIHI